MSEPEQEPPPTELKAALETLAALVNDVTDPLVVSLSGMLAGEKDLNIARKAWRTAEDRLLALIGRYQESGQHPSVVEDLRNVIRDMSAVLGIEPSV